MSISRTTASVSGSSAASWPIPTTTTRPPSAHALTAVCSGMGRASGRGV